MLTEAHQEHESEDFVEILFFFLLFLLCFPYTLFSGDIPDTNISCNSGAILLLLLLLHDLPDQAVPQAPSPQPQLMTHAFPSYLGWAALLHSAVPIWMHGLVYSMVRVT